MPRPYAPARGSLGALGWYTTTVKLDLEARGFIERMPKKKPQHLWRTAG